jgi:hypothetical protein
VPGFPPGTSSSDKLNISWSLRLEPKPNWGVNKW